LLLADIPDDILESFYRGRVFVLVKDAVFQPSTPLRHATEMNAVFKAAGLDNAMEVLLLYTDGGPDHNVKFISVWLGLLCIFLACDLDFLIAARTCPQQSWRNCVEKIMSLLNLAMYGVALVRKQMGDDNEDLIAKAGGTMANLRAEAKEGVDFQALCMQSVLPVRNLLEQRYSQLDLKGTPFETVSPASKEEMLHMLSFCAVIDASIPQTDAGLHMRSKELHSCKDLKQFFKLHTVPSEYFITISKACWTVEDNAIGGKKFVQSSECKVCKPPKMGAEHFEMLSARDPCPLPFPQPSRLNKDEWGKYDELKLCKTTDQYRPSLSLKKDKRKCTSGENVTKLGPKSVRTHYTCSNCEKACLVYCSRALSSIEQAQFEHYVEGANGYCGVLPLPSSNPLVTKLGLQVNTALKCAPIDTMEKNFYSPHVPRSAFPQPWPVLCFHCGGSNGVATDQELAKNHTIVYPQCVMCRNKKVKIQVGGKEKKNKNAPDIRRQMAEMQSSQRKEARQPVPAREAQYAVQRIVGKAKLGRMTKVFWKNVDTGEPCSKNECTWECSGAFDGGSGIASFSGCNCCIFWLQLATFSGCNCYIFWCNCCIFWLQLATISGCSYCIFLAFPSCNCCIFLAGFPDWMQLVAH
jgi:hypothetical protein